MSIHQTSMPQQENLQLQRWKYLYTAVPCGVRSCAIVSSTLYILPHLAAIPCIPANPKNEAFNTSQIAPLSTPAVHHTWWRRCSSMNRQKTGSAKGLLYKRAAILLICRYMDTQISLLKGNGVLAIPVLRLPPWLCLVFKQKFFSC